VTTLISLAEFTPRYDHVLIVGDSNFHICCPEKPQPFTFGWFRAFRPYAELIELVPLCQTVKSCPSARCFCALKPSTAAQSAAFTYEGTSQPSVSSNTEELLIKFYSACLTVLDSVAPLKIRQPKPRSEPWLNDHICARECRRAEWRWNRDRLQVSFEMLRGSWRCCQKLWKLLD